MNKVINVKSSVFGEKVFAEKTGFTVNFDWLGSIVEIEYDFYESKDPQGQINLLEDKFDDIKKWNEDILCFASKELFELANFEWKDDKKEDYTFESFKKQLKVVSLGLRFLKDDIKVVYWLISQDEVFGGHVIEMFGTLNKGFTTVSIVG